MILTVFRLQWHNLLQWPRNMQQFWVMWMWWKFHEYWLSWLYSGCLSPWHLQYLYVFTCNCILPSYTNLVLYLVCDSSSTCSGAGTCNISGLCQCNTHFEGHNCSYCTSDYFPIGTCNICVNTFPLTLFVYNMYLDCNDTISCSGHGACNSSGLCECDENFVGVDCSNCIPDFYPNGTCNICIFLLILILLKNFVHYVL